MDDLEQSCKVIASQPFAYCQQAGVALQLILEFEKCPQSFFCLLHKTAVALETGETNGVVDMRDSHSCSLEPFPEEHIFVTIMLEPFVKRIGKHHFTLNHEIGSVEVGVGRTATMLRVLCSDARQFVGIAQVALMVGVFLDGVSPVCQLPVVVCQVM